MPDTEWRETGSGDGENGTTSSGDEAGPQSNGSEAAAADDAGAGAGAGADANDAASASQKPNADSDSSSEDFMPAKRGRKNLNKGKKGEVSPPPKEPSVGKANAASKPRGAWATRLDSSPKNGARDNNNGASSGVPKHLQLPPDEWKEVTNWCTEDQMAGTCNDNSCAKAHAKSQGEWERWWAAAPKYIALRRMEVQDRTSPHEVCAHDMAEFGSCLNVAEGKCSLYHAYHRDEHLALVRIIPALVGRTGGPCIDMYTKGLCRRGIMCRNGHHPHNSSNAALVKWREENKEVENTPFYKNRMSKKNPHTTAQRPKPKAHARKNIVRPSDLKA